ncbi:unnamed protein product [Symbiodinium sp. CCMP2592]|nr:unnamed protein product [Symbiodinium sp. CCMP2592]
MAVDGASDSLSEVQEEADVATRADMIDKYDDDFDPAALPVKPPADLAVFVPALHEPGVPGKAAAARTEIRKVWLREILEGTDPEHCARDVKASAVIGRLTAGAKTVELRSKPCPSDRIGCKISLMETGTKLIKGTAILAESRALTVEEQIIFGGVLQAHRCVLQTLSTQTGSQALKYEAKQTYARVLQDVRVHPEPFEASATACRRECGEQYSHRCQRGRRMEPWFGYDASIA